MILWRKAEISTTADLGGGHSFKTQLIGTLGKIGRVWSEWNT